MQAFTQQVESCHNSELKHNVLHNFPHMQELLLFTGAVNLLKAVGAQQATVATRYIIL